MKTNDSNENHNLKKIIACIIIIIIIILLLITSCNSNLFGRIGEMFTGESNHVINPDDGDKEIILNKELIFDEDYHEISVDDNHYKISYSYKVINPSTFTCTTSNADIATCVVMDGYVEVNPKSEGEVSIYIETDTNGKIYRGSSKVVIEKSEKYISLSSKSGKINLLGNKTKKIYYTLIGIDGNVNVEVADDSIAGATAKNGVLTIKGKKTGKTKITLTVLYNDVTYQTTFSLTVVEEKKTTTTTGGNKTTTKKTTYDKDTTKKTSTEKNTSNKTTDKSTTSKKTSTSSKTTSKKTSSSKPISSSKTTSKTTSSSKTTSKTTTKSTTSGTTTKTTTSSTTTKTTTKAISKDSQLSDIKVSEGSLSPKFNKDTLNYQVNVGSDIERIDVNITKSSNKASVKYIFNGDIVTSINNLKLNKGDNLLIIEVTAEDGSSMSTYKVTINRALSVDNYLSKLEFDDYDLSPEFDKDINKYSLDVDYDTKNIDGAYKVNDSNSSIKIYNKGILVDSLEDLDIEEGTNKIKIVVTSESGDENTYVIDVYRPIRTIKFDEGVYEYKIEDSPFNIGYKVFEDNLEITNYDIKDITITSSDYKGIYEINNGYVVLKPSAEDADKSITLTINYNGRSSNVTIKFTTYDYYLDIYNNNYDITLEGGSGYRNIIFNTNIFSNDLVVESISNGIRIKNNDFTNGYVDITTSDSDIITLEFDEDDQTGLTSYKVKVIAKKSGSASLNIKGFIFNKEISDKNVTISVIQKFIITIDANGGFFDEFTNIYTFKLENSEQLDLSQYVPYKVDTTGNCMYYELKEYNTLAEGNGDSYQSNDVLSNFDKDLTLYAIYTDESKYIELKENTRLYLTEVDLFHNEEYYELYNESKVIYPGAYGSHVMTIDNNSGELLTLTGINLEEDTICISDKKCLNMGYIIKYSAPEDDNYTYYYGSETEYKILNKDINTTFTTGTLTGYHTENNILLNPVIEVANGESIEISLLWQWVSVDDDIDTKIGEGAVNLNDQFALTVSIDFDKTNTYCDLGD